MLLCYNIDNEKYTFLQNATKQGGDNMPIKYDKLIKLMKEKGITSYTIRRDKIIGQATYKKIVDGGDIDTRTIAKLCQLLECQPGDILEYVEE